MPLSFRHLGLWPLLALAGCNAGAESTLPLQPPIWIVSDADPKITLYPTLHLLPLEIEWRSEESIKHLADLEKVLFEIMPGPEHDPTLYGAMMQLASAAGFSLSSRLSPAEIKSPRLAAPQLIECDPGSQLL